MKTWLTGKGTLFHTVSPEHLRRMASSTSRSSSVKGAQDQLQEVLNDLGEIESELDHVRSSIDALVQQQDRLLSRKQDLRTKADQLQTLCQRLETERGDFQKSDFPWSSKLHRLKSSVFGIKSLRSMQEQVMNTTLSGRDCLLVMPTGAGKSLCYQLPALLSDGITLVVSPLVSLMEDQTLALEQLGVPAALLNASTPPDKLKSINAAMLDPKASLRLLYVTPEKIAKSKRFMAQLQKCYTKQRLARIAIDEVHCCSQWGHDFRPDYKMLGVLKRQFPEVPVLGLTATATAGVLEDVKSLLNLHACVILRSSYNRANLFYQVRAKPSKEADFTELLVQMLNGPYKGQSGIIYCLSRKNTEQVALALQTCHIRAEPYHADLDASVRSAVHGRWKSGHTQVVVATIAFGMGIDKPDVRFVIHHSLSKSLENYYQESGRAGRDDKPADCILFFQSSDVHRQSSMVMVEQTGLQKLYAMVAYCIDKHRCRRRIQAQHFDERWDVSKQQCNDKCDNCKDKAQVHDLTLRDYFASLLDILQVAAKKKERITPLKLVDKWLATKPTHTLQGTKPSPLTRVDCESILCHLLLEGYLKEDFHFTPYATISYVLPGPKATTPLTQPIILKFRCSEGDLPKTGASLEKSVQKMSSNGSKNKKLSDGEGTSSSHASIAHSSESLTGEKAKKPTREGDLKRKTGSRDTPNKKLKVKDSSEVIVIH